VILNLISVAAVFGAVVCFWQDGHGSDAVFDISGTGAVTFWPSSRRRRNRRSWTDQGLAALGVSTDAAWGLGVTAGAAVLSYGVWVIPRSGSHRCECLWLVRRE
jgi:hypothetical protein